MTVADWLPPIAVAIRQTRPSTWAILRIAFAPTHRAAVPTACAVQNRLGASIACNLPNLDQAKANTLVFAGQIFHLYSRVRDPLKRRPQPPIAFTAGSAACRKQQLMRRKGEMTHNRSPGIQGVDQLMQKIRISASKTVARPLGPGCYTNSVSPCWKVKMRPSGRVDSENKGSSSHAIFWLGASI